MTPKLKGQIPLATLITVGGAMIVAAISGWFSASNRVGVAETKIEVISEREGNHFQELSKSIEKLDKKLDILLSEKKQSGSILKTQ